MNLGAGRANWFGTSDSFQYLRDINVRLLPAAIPVTAAAFVSGRQYRPVLIAAIANILVHSLIAHKEYRFVWLSVLLIVILAALGTVELVNRLMERREGAQQRALAGLALCGGWGALSIASFNLTGGFETFRGGGYLTRTAIAAAEIPQTCGIALASRDRSHIANVYLPRRVALYLLPDAVIYGNKTFPAEVTGASNAIIMPGDRKSPPGYTQLSCQSEGEHKACLFWRKDGCHNLPAARGYTYQAVMAKDDM
jgi:hypothetical protein